SPGATFCRPLRGLRFFLGIVPPVRGLTGGYVLSPAARAPVFLGDRVPGSRTHRGIAFCRPLRGLRSFLGIVPPVRGLTGGYILSPAARAPVFLGDRTPGSRTHRGLHSVARCAGSGLSWAPYPGSRTHGGLRSVARCAGSGLSWGSCPRFADSPGDSVPSPAFAGSGFSWWSYARFADSPAPTFCRPLRGLRSFLGIVPPVRGLTGGYILSPAARAPVFLGDRTPGSRTHRGLHSVARCAGSGLSWGSCPRFADSPGATFCRPLRGLPSFLGSVPRFADSRWATFCRPLRGLRSFLGIVPPVRGLSGG